MKKRELACGLAHIIIAAYGSDVYQLKKKNISQAILCKTRTFSVLLTCTAGALSFMALRGHIQIHWLKKKKKKYSKYEIVY